MGAEFVKHVYSLRKEDGHAGLGGSRKAVLTCIAWHTNHQTLRCSLRYRTIAEEIGVSVRSVESAMPWLEERGYIARGRRNRRADGTLGAYTFKLVPPAAIAAGPPAKSAGNHPRNLRRSNQLHEPTASSSTKRRTAEGEEAGKFIERTTA